MSFIVLILLRGGVRTGRWLGLISLFHSIALDEITKRFISKQNSSAYTDVDEARFSELLHSALTEAEGISESRFGIERVGLFLVGHTRRNSW